MTKLHKSTVLKVSLIKHVKSKNIGYRAFQNSCFETHCFQTGIFKMGVTVASAPNDKRTFKELKKMVYSKTIKSDTTVQKWYCGFFLTKAPKWHFWTVDQNLKAQKIDECQHSSSSCHIYTLKFLIGIRCNY